MKLNQYQLITAGLLSLTICSGLVLTSTKSYADNDSATDDVNITVPVACTMSGNIATGQEHTATLSPGTYSAASGSDYENGIGTTTLTTFCNDNNGFSVYAIGFTGDTAGNNTLVGTSASNNATISTDTYTPGDTTSSWSMKVDKVTDTTSSYNPANMTIDNSFNSYHAVPSEYTRVAHYKATTGSSTTDTTLGAKLTTTYAAFISQTQPADTYTGQVKYVMVHPYMQDDSNKPTTAFIMQNVSQWGSSVTAGQEVTAIDSRDGKSYTVARLADGNLWMTQNLDHDIKNDGTVTYDNTTTDLGWNTSTNSYNTASWTPVAATHATGDTEWGEYDENTNPDGGDLSHAESYDPGDLYWNGTIINDQSSCESAGGTWNGWCNGYTNPTASTGDSHYGLGNHYNWTAAVAMDDSSSYTTYGTLIEQSICPAGWTLPRVGTGDDTFGALWNIYNLNEISFTDTNGNGAWDTNESALWTTPLYFIASGKNRGSGLTEVGVNGRFWSPVSEDGEGAFEATLGTDGFVGPGSASRIDGNPIRCIARPVSNSVSGL